MVERETMRPERISKELIERFVCGSRIDGGKTVFFLLKLFRMYLNRSASYLTSLIAVVLFLIVFGGITTYSQACQQIGNIEIRLQDENEKPVRNASIKFINIPDGAPLDDHEFTEYRESFGSLYVGRYCESEIVGKEGKNGFTRSYDVSVSAKGYRDVKTKISIYHCLGQCLVNRAFVTIVGESAKLVTIKGTVKISLPAGYSEKGRLSSSEKIVSGAPIKFKRSAMTEFSTTSDADGNFQITVPQGSYSVYASANLNCVLCAEYFGNVVGRSETTVLNIVLRFYGEG